MADGVNFSGLDDESKVVDDTREESDDEAAMMAELDRIRKKREEQKLRHVN
ncbi:hypothetical protein LINPERPRIM_LOCUS29891 [Linum perenne]